MQTPPAEISLHVSVGRQEMEVRDAAGACLRRYPVSTSRFGVGSEAGSNRTPLGRFHVGNKIGGGVKLGTIFKSRAPTGESGLGVTEGDLVLTRILWLAGDEPQNANTHARYIYIHGTNHEAAIGQAASHGCVRMRNADVAALYELAAVGTPVFITAA